MVNNFYEIVKKVNSMTNSQVRAQVILLLLETDREGVNDLIKFLLDSDFFKMPASTKWHLPEEGGLARHSLSVYNFFKHILIELGVFDTHKNSIVLSALLHDVCKHDSYKLVEDKWKYNQTDDNRHAQKSINIITKLINLKSIEEKMIKYHMGIYMTTEFLAGSTYATPEYSLNDMSIAFDSDLAKLMHFADNLSSIYGM